MQPPDPPNANAWSSNMVALYVAMLRSGFHFAQAVYGDGEWKNILGTGEGTNDQGERFCKPLGDSLRATLTNDVGVWNVLWPGRAGASTHAGALRWIQQHAPGTTWLPFRPLSWAMIMGLGAPFLKQLKRHRVILVGPRHMKRLDERVLKPVHHVQVPDSTAWDYADATVEHVLNHFEDGTVVLFSAGQGSCLMIHRLWPSLRSCAVLLDTGSMFDPYCGVNSRRAYDSDYFNIVKDRNIP